MFQKIEGILMANVPFKLDADLENPKRQPKGYSFMSAFPGL